MAKKGQRKKPSTKGPKQAIQETAPSTPYTVLMTESAERAYKELFRKAREAEERGDAANGNCTAFRMVREAIKDIIPKAPHDKRFALAGDLSNIFRVKKGRMRIFWVASSRNRRICILFISESARKEGDVNDPYPVFASMVMSGQFNDIFSHLGVKIPKLAIKPFGIQ